MGHSIYPINQIRFSLPYILIVACIEFLCLLTISLSQFENEKISFVTPQPLPETTIGNIPCEEHQMIITDTVKKMYPTNYSEFLLQKYYQFGKYQYQNASIANLHYIFSSLFGYIKGPNHCPDYPPHFPKSLNEAALPYANLDFGDPHVPEVFYFEHGLKLADPKIQKYVKERDMMDIGAFNGDSAFVLRKRTNKRIFSYEFAAENVEKFRKNAKKFHFNPKKNILVTKGISDKKETIFLQSCVGVGCRISENGTIPIELSTIDDEVIEKKMKLGFFKADVEGAGLKVLEGAKKTFEKHRPVFAISIYHTFDELLLIPEFVQQLPDYEFIFNFESWYKGNFGEMSLFGYPKSILRN